MKKFRILIFFAAVFLISGCCCNKLNLVVLEKNAILLDVRTPEEYQLKHLKSAVNLPLADIDTNTDELIPDKNTPIYLYCRSGRRSKDAMGKLQQQGYSNVTDFGSMSNAEKKLNFPEVSETKNK